MQILHSSETCPPELRGSVLAIGNFDGVHKGHQAVLRSAIEIARRTQSPSGAMTFEPHPRSFFQPDKPVFRLTGEGIKLRLLASLGLDMSVVQPFDADLASKPAARFVGDILIDRLGVSHVVTGHDFHFGKGRDGNPDVLRKLGQKHGFGVTIVDARGSDAGIYSSSRIRDHLRGGEPKAAAEDLGYWWRVAGEVTGGDRRGHGLGFPTANIALPGSFELKHGIYAVRVHTQQGVHGGASYLGTRPSFDDGAPVLETFLFDFDGDLYGQEIEIEFIEFLREDRKFDDPEQLVGQMKEDCRRALDILSALEQDDPFGPGLLGAA